ASREQDRDHPGLGFGTKATPRQRWRLARVAVARQDGVVDEGEPARAVEMRMRVLLGHTAVRGPARVPDADRARGQVRRSLADLADAALEDDAVSVTDGHTPRIVAAILELLEPAQDEVRRVSITADVTEDATHGEPPARGGCADGEARRRAENGALLH